MQGRRPRADAAANRAAVLLAAQSAFAEQGPDVALDEIARRAGVGPGTVHRHFPTKQALIAAVVVDRFTDLSALAESYIDMQDPGPAFFEYLHRLVGEAAHNQALAWALTADRSEQVAAAGATLRDRTGILLRRAQRAGAVRGDLTDDDLHALVVGAVEAERRLPAERHGLGVEFLCSGLRAHAQG
ncbi:TetR/AcrR family transcriptional regulator [Streptomyces sp. NPDC059568]|uniref:TetR/AcrR family transcriptional regulator n=1 Tax=Streptomyces sp. NPDC059568 TaxID=3346868 RepID=UPI0036A919A9